MSNKTRHGGERLRPLPAGLLVERSTGADAPDVVRTVTAAFMLGKSDVR